MNSSAIHIHNVSKRFNSHEALKQISLQVPTGSIYGLLGPNGAGKTTTIKILLNLLQADNGEAEVLGKSSHLLLWREFQKIGYVSTDQQLPQDMSVQELLGFLRPFYPSWDAQLGQALLNQFHLPMERKIRHLSRGMQMQVALLSALIFRPELLILDEPFTGLNPVLKDDFTKGLLGTVADFNGTVFMSSHDVEEVERLCDWVGMMKPGRLVISEPLDRLLNRFRRIDLTVASGEVPLLDADPDIVSSVTSGRTLQIVHQNFNEETTLLHLHNRLPSSVAIEDFSMPLREIYLTVARLNTY